MVAFVVLACGDRLEVFEEAFGACDICLGFFYRGLGFMVHSVI